MMNITFYCNMSQIDDLVLVRLMYIGVLVEYWLMHTSTEVQGCVQSSGSLNMFPDQLGSEVDITIIIM